MRIDDLLGIAAKQNAAYVHLKVGQVPIFRIEGEIVLQSELPIVTNEDIETAFAEMTTAEQRSHFASEMDMDFAYQSSLIGRARVNACRQGGTVSLTFHLVRAQIPTIEELGLPEICKPFVFKSSGLIVVTGPTGCGKSTTVRAMIDYLNHRQKRKVVTIEDPIEFLFKEDKCVFYQRELGTDTRSFASALKYALRQDPDVILVGEIPDQETVAGVLRAAGTGHLVLTTLHTPSTAGAIDRLIDMFPPYQRPQAREQLSTTLEAVLYQTLVPRHDNSARIAAVEVMIATPEVRNLIREDRIDQIGGLIQKGSGYGMQTLNQALLALYCQELITAEQALARSPHADELRDMLAASCQITPPQ